MLKLHMPNGSFVTAAVTLVIRPNPEFAPRTLASCPGPRSAEACSHGRELTWTLRNFPRPPFVVLNRDDGPGGSFALQPSYSATAASILPFIAPMYAHAGPPQSRRRGAHPPHSTRL